MDVALQHHIQRLQEWCGRFAGVELVKRSVKGGVKEVKMAVRMSSVRKLVCEQAGVPEARAIEAGLAQYLPDALVAFPTQVCALSDMFPTDAVVDCESLQMLLRLTIARRGQLHPDVTLLAFRFYLAWDPQLGRPKISFDSLNSDIAVSNHNAVLEGWVSFLSLYRLLYPLTIWRMQQSSHGAHLCFNDLICAIEKHAVTTTYFACNLLQRAASRSLRNFEVKRSEAYLMRRAGWSTRRGCDKMRALSHVWVCVADRVCLALVASGAAPVIACALDGGATPAGVV